MVVISLEGIDTAGKTTIGRLLRDSIDNSVFVESAPKEIKRIVDDQPVEIRFLGYMLANAKLSEYINKHKDEYDLFIVDRFHHSTVAYHACLAEEKGSDKNRIYSLANHIVDDLNLVVPDYVVWFDVDDEVALGRMLARGELTRMDEKMKDFEFTGRVRDEYENMFADGEFYNNAFVYIDTTNRNVYETLDDVIHNLCDMGVLDGSRIKSYAERR